MTKIPACCHDSISLLVIELPYDLALALLEAVLTGTVGAVLGIFIFYIRLNKQNKYIYNRQISLLMTEIDKNISDIQEKLIESDARRGFIFLSLQSHTALSILSRGELTKWMTENQRTAIIDYISLVDEVHFLHNISINYFAVRLYFSKDILNDESMSDLTDILRESAQDFVDRLIEVKGQISRDQ